MAIQFKKHVHNGGTTTEFRAQKQTVNPGQDLRLHLADIQQVVDWCEQNLGPQDDPSSGQHLWHYDLDRRQKVKTKDLNPKPWLTSWYFSVICNDDALAMQFTLAHDCI